MSSYSWASCKPAEESERQSVDRVRGDVLRSGEPLFEEVVLVTTLHFLQKTQVCSTAHGCGFVQETDLGILGIR